MIETRTTGGREMSGKRTKSGQQAMGHVVPSAADNLAEKEQADRIAAAEAMSCLSSVILLSSDLDTLGGDSVAKTQQKTHKRVRNSPKNPTGEKAKTESKRGKSRGGKGRGNSANRRRENNDSDVVLQAMLKANSTVTGNNMVCVEGVSQNTSVLSHVGMVPMSQAPYVASVPPRTAAGPPGAVSAPSNAVTISSIPSELQLALLSKLNAREHLRTSQSGDHFVLKLPLVINNERANINSPPTAGPVVSPVSAVSSDSVEITQSTVERLLQPHTKFDSVESALPLKKRRLLQGYLENASAPSDDFHVTMANSQAANHKRGNVIDLTAVKLEPEDQSDYRRQVTAAVPTTAALPLPSNVTPVSAVTPTTLTPVSVDPRTSLMLLTEMQMALHQDEDGDLPLHIAVAQENIVMVQKFVHLMSISGKSVDKYNKAQQTPLHLAVELDFVEAVKILLMARANPNLVNKRGENAVHLAVKVQSTSCLQVMIKHSHNKTDLNTRNFEGLAPLHTAVEKNNVDIVDLLLHAGADINILDGKSGKTPLFYAVEHNFLLMLEFLQSKSANIDLANYAGITVVMAAQARGYQEAATILLKGLDVQAYHELKESTPTMKIPIPRIPSKSHLIIAGENSSSSSKSAKLANQNSDSNSNDSLPANKADLGAIVERAFKEEIMDPSMIKFEFRGENGLSGFQLALDGYDVHDHETFAFQGRSKAFTHPELTRQISGTSASLPGSYLTLHDRKPLLNTSHFVPSQETRPLPQQVTRLQPPQVATPPPLQVSRPPPQKVLSFPPVQVSISPPLLVSRTSPLQVSQTPPLQISQTAPLQVSQTPPLRISQTPPLQVSQTPPLHVSQAPPLQVSLTPPLHVSQAPPPQISLTPPLYFSQAQAMQVSRTPPPQVCKPLHPVVTNLPPPQVSEHQPPDMNTVVRDNITDMHTVVYQIQDGRTDPSKNSSNINNCSPLPMDTTPYLMYNSPHRNSSQKKTFKVNSSGKVHVDRSGSGSKGQSSGSSKPPMPSSQMYHLTNISRSTASILAAKLQGIYTAKGGGSVRPPGPSKDLKDSVHVKDER